MIAKLIFHYKKHILFIVSLLPKSFQGFLKTIYRKLITHSLYSNMRKIDGSFDLKKNAYRRPSFVLESSEAGVNLVGFPKGEFGLAEHLRSVGRAFDLHSQEYLYYDCQKLSLHSQDDSSVENKIEDHLKYNTNIFVCNGDIIASLYNVTGNEFFSDRYNILYGAWELRDYPLEWLPTLSIFHEYWAMSSFLQKSVSDVAQIPVLHMPYPVDFAIPTQYSRKDFNLPEDKFLFIFTFDISSLASRKNPVGVIKAFLAAFPKNDDVGLVVKITSNKDYATQQQEIRSIISLAKDDPRVYLVNEVLPRDKILGLINACDVYVSLHRAEGFGIGMAEAMKMAKPVIATNYSGNTDFTLPHNSCLVDYKLIPIKPNEYIYEYGKVWADPDIDHAASHMQKLFFDSDFYKKISLEGKKFIDKNYNNKIVKEKYVARLKILGLF